MICISKYCPSSGNNDEEEMAMDKISKVNSGEYIRFFTSLMSVTFLNDMHDFVPQKTNSEKYDFVCRIELIKTFIM